MGSPPTAGIVLAAGRSSRMRHPKQLLVVKGRPITAWVLDAALRSMLDHVVLVVGYEVENVLGSLSRAMGRDFLGIEVVKNPRYEEGLAASIKAGLGRVHDRYPSVMFMLGDQPLIDKDLIDSLLQSFWSSDKEICAPVFKGRRGHPVVFGRRFYGDIMNLDGDTGPRDLIEEHRDEFQELCVTDDSCLVDVDTMEDYIGLLKVLGEGPTHNTNPSEDC